MALDLSALDDAIPHTPSATGAPLLLASSLLAEDRNNPRTVFDEVTLKALAADIKERGILQPIIVQAADATGRYMILFGARRYRAALLAGLVEIPCIVAQDKRQLDSYAQVAENHQREGLTPLEYAAFIAGRIAAGDKKKDIAARLNITPARLTYYVSIIDPPAFLLELYHAGKCTTPEYLYRLRNLHNNHPKEVENRTAAAAVITGPWLDELTAALNAGKQEPPPKTKPGQGGNGSKLQPSGGDDADGDKANYRIVMVKNKDRPAQLNLQRRASAIGLGWIKYLDDGSQEEVTLDKLMVDSLIES